MSADDLDDLRVAEMRDLASQLGLSTSGRKADLKARLEEYLQEHGTLEPETDDDEDDDDEEDEDGGAVVLRSKDPIETEPEDDDFQMDSEDDEDDDDEDEHARYYMNGQEVLGLIVRTNGQDEEREDGDGENSEDDDEVLFIPASDLDDSYAVVRREDASDVFASDEDSDDEVTTEEALKAMIDEDDDEEFAPSSIARTTCTVLSALELLALLYRLIIEPIKDNNVIFHKLVFEGLSRSLVDLVFWEQLTAYIILFFIVPTFIGILLGRYSHPHSVFGFAVSRFAIHYMLEDWQFFATLFGFVPRMFNLTCAVSVIMAFWQHQDELIDF